MGEEAVTSVYKSEAGRRAVEARYREFLTDWPVACEHLRLFTREGETFVVACGPKEASPVILLHGSPSNAASWTVTVDLAALAAQRRLYVVDIVGEPGLSAPSRLSFDGDAYSQWLDDVMAGLGLARAAFLGTSFGSWIALDYAMRRTDRVEALVLICPAGIGGRRNTFVLPALALSLLGPGGRDLALRLAIGAPPDPHGERRRFDAFVKLILEHVVLRRAALPTFSDDQLHRLSMPSLAIVGAKDRLVNSAETRARLQRAVARARLRWLPDAGHVVLGQTESILAFLDEQLVV